MTYDFIIATDGACKGNPGKGTWAMAVFDTKDEYRGKLIGHDHNTTNNIMEMTAVLAALKWSNRHGLKVLIKTDSNYTMKGLTEWLSGWKRRGWKNSKGEAVANKELWEQLSLEYEPSRHTLEKVKGHSGDKYNDMADMLCNEEYINAFM